MGLDLGDVRRWAEENNFPVGTRGRIKDEIKTAYLVAHGKGAEPAVASPPRQAPQAPESLVARPLASPGVAESYGDDAAAVARLYVPGADHKDLTEELCQRAQDKHAAIVRIGAELKLYRDSPVPAGGLVILDYRR
jgi:hypothetical protein